MSSGDTKGSHHVHRPGLAWWQWVIGGGLLGMAAFFTLIRATSDRWLRPVKPREVQVAGTLRPSEVVPAAHGDLAGCNLLLVTFDTTRADRIGCYGNDQISTFSLDRLASEGVLFSDVVAPSPTTLPSHSSLLTGLYPYHHGARANGLYRLDSKFVTLAEVLADQGYATGAAVSASVLESQYGIAQGFQDYDDETDTSLHDDPGCLAIAERTGEQTVARAEEWLRAHATDPFFLWVHFYDPHFPYKPPAPYSEKYNAYDGEIAYTDAQLGKLMHLMDELGITDKTLIVVAGDHGEGLGQHGEAAHACLIYESTMRVPLIMRCGNRLGGGVHVSHLVSLVDVMPTVLNLLGIDAPADLDGIDLTQPPPASRWVFMETLQGLADHGWAALLGARQNAQKYIYGPTCELYDLAQDPFEQSDLLAGQPQLAAEMQERLEAFFGADLEKATSTAPTHAIDPQELAKLQSLGYLQNVGSELAPPSSRPHPKDMMPVLTEVFNATALAKTKGDDASIARLEKIARQHPDFYQVHLLLGNAYAKRGDLDLAEAAYLMSMRLRPGQFQPVVAMAGLLTRQKRPEEAISLYREHLDSNPDDFLVLKNLGQLLMARGEYAEAMELMTRALQLWPRDENLPDTIAQAAHALGRTDQAIALCQSLLESSPDLPMVRNALSGLLFEKQQFAEAASILREGIKLAPEERGLVNNLAYLMISSPDPEINHPKEAAVMMERICYETNYEDPRYLHTLSLVYASMGRLDEAISVATKARDIAAASEKPEFSQLTSFIGLSIERYKAAKQGGVTTPTSPPSADEELAPANGAPATDPVSPEQDTGPADESP